jgi:hypothetical protein
MKKCLLDAAEEVGNRMVVISNARLPKQPSKEFTTGIFGSIGSNLLPISDRHSFRFLRPHRNGVVV